jgi:hypothetical protein
MVAKTIPLPGCFYVVIMEPMFPRMVAKAILPLPGCSYFGDHEANGLPGCSHDGDHGANVSHKGGKDNHSHYLATPMLVIMEPMFPTMVAKTVTPIIWLLPCW